MVLFQDIQDLNNHILVRKLIDINYLTTYEEVAIRTKINRFISNEVINQIISEPEYSEQLKLIKKSVAHYTIPLAIPFIKVLISNSGTSNTKDSRLQKSDWWDIRDMAIQSANIADQALTDAIESLKETPLFSRLEISEKVRNLPFISPLEIRNYTGYKMGYDVFLDAVPTMELVWLSIIQDKYQDCVLDNLNDYTKLENLIKKAAAFYILADMAQSNAFVFNGVGFFIKWEQLPWQKSAIIDEKSVNKYIENLYKKANTYINLANKFIKKNISDFPCMETFPTYRKVIKKKSGLYF